MLKMALLSKHLFVSEHVQSVISKCAQSMHALKILRSHGMSSDALKVIYKSVVLIKLLYASPAWWGFATSADKRRRLEAFLRRGVRPRSASNCTALSTPRCHNVCRILTMNSSVMVRGENLPSPIDLSYRHTTQ